MRKLKWLAMLLALCLLTGLVPAATMEDLTIEDVDGEAEAVFFDDGVGEDGLELPPELELTEDEPALEEENIDLPGLDMALEADDGAEGAVVDNATGSLVRITKPANGATVSTGKVALWCTFVNVNASGGFSAGDAWRYLPMRLQVLKGDALISDETLSDYSNLVFTDEGQQYATLYLMEAGSYTIRVSVPGSPNEWDSVQVTATGTSITPAPEATRTPVSDDALAVITKPEQNERLVAESKFPIEIRLRKPASGTYSDALYKPIRVEVLGSRGNLVWATDVSRGDIGDSVESGKAFEIARPSLDVGGNYTIRVRAGESSVWDSVQVFVQGPLYPSARDNTAYSVTPGVSRVTIDLAKDKVARIPFVLKSGAGPDNNFIYYCDFVEDGDATIRYKAMSDYQLVKSGDSWVADGWIEYEGVKVGSTTLHVYILVNGARYDHHAITVNVIDSSKVSAVTPTPTATSKPTPTPTASTAPTPAPGKVSLSKCKFTVKSQVYTGKALKPAVTVKYGGKTLKKGTDYTVTYSGNKAVGTATATVKGKGNYTGTKKVTFKILPPAVALSQLTAGSKSFTAKWKQGKANTGYQLQYALKKNFSGAKTVTVKKARTVSATVKSLQSGKTYYVRLRAYKTVSKKNYYSAWSKAKSVKVK